MTALGAAVSSAAAALAGSLERYRASYVDLVLAARTERGTAALVAGCHTRQFPYADSEPWDNCLLLVGDAGYTFTDRTQRAALRFELDLAGDAPRGVIRFAGDMVRVRDRSPVRVDLEIAVALVRLPTRLLGESYNFLKLDGAVGMAYTPYQLSGERGRVRIDGPDGVDLELGEVRGSCERGELINLKAHDFAIKYDYVGVACPGDDGSSYVQFTSHTLHDGTILRSALDCYLRHSASAMMTIEPGALSDGNPRGVYSPPQDDPAVVLFEDRVDLGPAVLQRQMIRTHDRSGRMLHGLREIFTAKPAPARRPRLALSRARLNALLIGLIALDVVLSTVALGFPATWTQAMHGLPYDDPAGLLRRAGGVWAAFVVLQAIALARWPRRPCWLALIAGVRFTELFSDWVTLAAARHVTTLGTVALVTAPPANLLFGCMLLATYRRCVDAVR
jgi:hypothetical protein